MWNRHLAYFIRFKGANVFFDTLIILLLLVVLFSSSYYFFDDGNFNNMPYCATVMRAVDLDNGFSSRSPTTTNLDIGAPKKDVDSTNKMGDKCDNTVSQVPKQKNTQAGKVKPSLAHKSTEVDIFPPGTDGGLLDLEVTTPSSSPSPLQSEESSPVSSGSSLLDRRSYSGASTSSSVHYPRRNNNWNNQSRDHRGNSNGYNYHNNGRRDDYRNNNYNNNNNNRGNFQKKNHTNQYYHQGNYNANGYGNHQHQNHRYHNGYSHNGGYKNYGNRRHQHDQYNHHHNNHHLQHNHGHGNVGNTNSRYQENHQQLESMSDGSPLVYKSLISNNPSSPFEFLCTTPANSPLLSNAFALSSGRDFPAFAGFHPHPFFDYTLVNCGSKCAKVHECDSHCNNSNTTPVFSVTTPPPNLLMATDPKAGKVDSSTELKIGEWVDPNLEAGGDLSSSTEKIAGSSSSSSDDTFDEKKSEESDSSLTKVSYCNSKKRYFNGANVGAMKLASNYFPHRPMAKRCIHPFSHSFPPSWNVDINVDQVVNEVEFGEVRARPESLLRQSKLTTLSEAVWAKFYANQQSTETLRKKVELWRDVQRIVRNLKYTQRDLRDDPRNFPVYGLHVVGSTLSGFGSNSSDVDMCFLIRREEVDQRFEATDKLSALMHELRNHPIFQDVEIIYAKVPILRFRDSSRNLDVDLNCNNHVGIQNTHLLYCYSQMDWRLKPLVLVVKLWAQFQGINDPKNMTISSYSLALMVIFFLQHGCKPPVLPCLQQLFPHKFNDFQDVLWIKINETVPTTWKSENTETLGELLLSFLEYYSRNFDYQKFAVSVRVGNLLHIKHCAQMKTPKNDPHQWKYLCVEEPFDLTNTARSVYDRDAFDKIRGVFFTSWQRLLVTGDLQAIFTPISESDARSIANRLR